MPGSPLPDPFQSLPAGSKKRDKHAKESGGVLAAVTKHQAKSSNGSTPKDVDTLSDSPPQQTPELKPATPATIPTRGHHNLNPGASPLLDAASNTSVSASTAPSAAGDWAKTMGPFGGSPSNLISLMGESPPTQPSSYEDHRPISYAWPSYQQQQRAYSNGQLPAASPPTGGKRPLSFQMDAQFPAHDLRSQASSPPGARRSSMHSPFAAPRGGSHPPLPHQPQAHFYGAPDLDFDLNPTGGLKPGERGYYVGFDTFSSGGGSHPAGADNVVLVGYEGGLEVYSVNKRTLEPLANLKGLRGGVYDAKILPWSGAHDPWGIFPLVAVVVHGPVPPSVNPEVLAVDPRGEEAASPRLDGVHSPQLDGNQRPAAGGKTLPSIEAYQTTVEVYSLQTNRLVDVLLRMPSIPIKTSISSPVFRSPPPAGAFQIHAGDGNVIVSSGTTGECWIYRHARCENEPGYEFRCVAKVWTSLQHGLKGESTPEEEERSRSPIPIPKNPQTPILAVHGRWLAYCPPTPSSQIALNASIPVPIEGRAPGLASATSPVLPNESADVDQPHPDPMVNRLMRETTQEVIQGALWVGKHGKQWWNNYWKPGHQQPQSRTAAVGSPTWSSGYPSRADPSKFPPTYGIAGQPVTKDPGLVSILDLPGLASSATVHHLTTFKPPQGCSFLSFSPTGLSLFTASSKGDVQTVWDLMRIQHTKSSALQNSQPNNGHASRVRQIAQFSRMTVARIVDVAWSRPNGERIAMVTERGTVHLFDMPPSAYSWPPPRRRIKAQESNAATSEAAPSAVSMASNALSSAYGAARPLINRQRRSSTSAQGSSRIMDHASYGGKVLAAGISHSLGNAGTAINNFRHTGENRVSLPLGHMTPVRSCVMWISGRKQHTLLAIGDGMVRIFSGKSQGLHSGASKRRVARGKKYRDFKLRNLPDDIIAPSIKRFIDPDDDVDLTYQDLDGGHTLVLNPRTRSPDLDPSPESSIPQAEIESSAPYQPFHTDKRVGLFEFRSPADINSLSLPLGAATLEEKPRRGKRKQTPRRSQNDAWAFGLPLSLTKVETGVPAMTEEEFNGGGSVEDHRALPVSAMERVLQVGDNEEQIVVTTRRRRNENRSSETDEEEFFEDECEVIDFADQRV